MNTSPDSGRNEFRIRRGTLLLATCLCLVVARPARAQIIGGTVTGGSAHTAGGTFVNLLDPIGNVGNNNQQSPNLFAFSEQQNVLLSGPLTLNIPGGTIVSPGLTLPAGTRVSSYYVFFDPEPQQRVIGTVNFGPEVLGIITSGELLAASDFLGNPTANYLNPSLRGLETNQDDMVSLLDAHTISVSLLASTPGDYIRVITVPEPGTGTCLILGLLSLIGCLWERRRQF